MKKAVTFLALVTFLTLLLITGLVYFFSKYGRALEEKTGLVQGDSAEVLGTEALFKAPPGRIAPSDLEIFKPLDQHVFFENPITLGGKAKADNVLLTLNNGEDKLLTTDGEGRFKTELYLSEGANQINVLTTDDDGREIVEEMVVGLYPIGKEQLEEYIALLGEIRTISFTKRSLEVITHKDTLSLTVGLAAHIVKVNEKGGVTAGSFNQLENTERIGVIAARNIDQGLIAREIKVDLYPYNFYGNVVEKLEDSIVVERKRQGGPRSTVILKEESKVVKWDSNNELKAISAADIKIGDRVYVNGFLLPKENRTNFFANRILVLGRV